MMEYKTDYLVSKPSLGNIIFEGKSEENVIFSIGKGQLSWIQKEGFYLINFWVRAEFELEMPDGQMSLCWGPTLEILMKTKENLNQIDFLELHIPDNELVKDEWGINYYTHYYYEIHQGFENAKLLLNRIEGNLFDIRFSGVPYEDRSRYEVKGNCQLRLLDELKGYWLRNKSLS